ncbi:alpha-1,6 mannosyltransferase subunit [Aspergillus brunneoviolaceus CBS 621.78]|uniref:Alpha-1,6 mannosyltransferase subunit n=1 Tax=Aspergillus brunneoviolaceus CBS 621.78 TaxID=1450534 RepID=A0ACD1FU74_9EURO|nr:alpha-1,6 mannosyltransferase subunit [Aspergillus brunneoviolaceus CBS 621.78]RAH40503.1 alpha-1,6 mannosyltransferase subunit [Aspergillus brunneoviolaceus CBS 621.78]
MSSNPSPVASPTTSLAERPSSQKMAKAGTESGVPPPSTSSKRDYKGFVAGVFSGIAKLTVGHPFDTVKVRLQTSHDSHFRGPVDCVLQTVRKEGVSGLYKGATPPLVGWMVMDSVMLGSLTLYRRLLLENVFSKPHIRAMTPFSGRQTDPTTLPSFGHGIAGIMAGTTVSFIAAPVEHVKARLQIQYSADKTKRMYSGPIDCVRKLLRTHGISGLYRGLCATIVFRAFFFFWWGSYDVLTRMLKEKTSLSAPAINFWAGGISAQIFWLTSYPSDVVKQRLMTDPMGGALGDGERKFRRWKDAAVAVYRERGLKGYWRGFVPCFLRAFPANAMALVAFEGVMREAIPRIRERNDNPPCNSHRKLIFLAVEPGLATMAAARHMRRTSPITLLLAALLAFGFLCFLLSPSPSAAAAAAGNAPPDLDSSQLRREDAAEHPLSPPTKPFLKSQAVREDGHAAAPPVEHYNLNALTSTSDAARKGERVLILTPLARFYQEYWDNVVALSYPHELISVGFIVPKTKDGNAAVAALEHAISVTQNGPVADRFASVSILRQDFEPPLQSQDEKERHKLENQKARRESMSLARNSLLFTTLGPATSWVLWLDSDIIETPPSLIQDLTGHDRPVIVPNCFQRYYNKDAKKMDVRPYDFNSWIDSATAQQLADTMGPDEILLEGYAELPTYRSLMAYLANKDYPQPGREIRLDGVGGTALMVKADVHRDGAMFPAFPFYHLVETEGFAKMAQRLGYEVFGLPDYFVYHYNE